MRLLLDTHAALWWLRADERFGKVARAEVKSGMHQVLLSAAVVWEVAIKRSLAKLDAPAAFADALLRQGAIALPISLAHAEAVANLPLHHRDPFDRLLVAQAVEEGAVLVTRDPAFEPYGVRTLW